MTDEQVTMVQRSWEQVVPIADTAAGLFYGRLFETAPHTRPLFTGDLDEQGRKLMQMITTVVRSLDRLDRVVPAVQALGRRHATYGVADADYAPVGAALLWTLEQGLGEAWNDELRGAWTSAYTTLADTMRAAAATATAA
jgi:hemoglobin-like flavoprotein